ncbi:MAG: murein biosynthesis integral membrane protein MurJ [Clostridiales bacterium]|jgi:putative peptidoglycan lipid II flippase|nr:murein biosynthesis integral membrane protein MurJ [Clostridiales bacterium]
MTKKGESPLSVISAMMAITLIGKALGLVREILIGSALGSGAQAAAFNLASAIPRNFLDITFASAISGCFIPVFNSAIAKNGKEEAFKIANVFITAVLILATAITVLLMMFSRPLAAVMGPGNNAATQELTSNLFIITMPIIILSALAFSFIGILQSMGEFNIPAAMSIVSNGCIIIYCLFFAERFGANGLAAVFLFGWFLQVLIQLPALMKIKYSFRFSFNFKSPAMLEIAGLILPVMISTWVMPVNDTVNIALSSQVSESAAVAYSKANVLYSVITGVFVLSVANFVFPKLTRINANENDEEFGTTLETVIRSLFYFLIPMAAGLFLLSVPICRMLFLTGKFDENAVMQTAEALAYFSFGIIGFGLQSILSRAFYAQKNAVVPLLTGICAIAVNFILSSVLKNYLGVGGPALAVSVSFCLTAGIMLFFMRKKNKRIVNIKMLKDILYICISSGVMAAAVWAVGLLFGKLSIGYGRATDLLWVGSAAAVGAAVYFGCTLAFRVREAGVAAQVAKGIFRKAVIRKRK